jgi:hypothetical protein
MKPLSDLSPLVIARPILRDDQVLATSKWIDLKDAKGVYVIVNHKYGGDTNLVVGLYVGAAATGTTANTFNVKWWKAADVATSNKLVRGSDATTNTINTSAGKDQLLVGYVDASQVAAQVAGGRYLKVNCTGGNSASSSTVMYQLVGARYQGDESTPTLS